MATEGRRGPSGTCSTSPAWERGPQSLPSRQRFCDLRPGSNENGTDEAPPNGSPRRPSRRDLRRDNVTQGTSRLYVKPPCPSVSTSYSRCSSDGTFITQLDPNETPVRKIATTAARLPQDGHGRPATHRASGSRPAHEVREAWLSRRRERFQPQASPYGKSACCSIPGRRGLLRAFLETTDPSFRGASTVGVWLLIGVQKLHHVSND